MSKGNRNQNQNQNQQSQNLGELHGNVEVSVQETEQKQTQQQATAAVSEEKQSLFSTKHSGGGFAGSYIGAAAGAIGSAVATLLSDEQLGWQDAAAAGASAVVGFGIGMGIDKFINNDYARYAASSAVAGGVGFTTGSLAQGFKGGNAPIEVTELPSSMEV